MLLVALAGLVALVGAGCGPGGPGDGNLLANPGFEAGREGWHHLADNPNWGDFAIVDAPVRSGARAAHLPLRWESGRAGQPARVYGVIQEPSPEAFPDVVSGWYRVERWSRESEETLLYLQVVVIVWGDPRTPELVETDLPPERVTNYQLRYYLAGLERPAFRLVNAKLVFVRRGPPPIGSWVYFELPVKRDFERLWGVAPEGYDSVRLLFEARWDDKPEGSGVHADAYFDDLFFGPAAGAGAS